jgi:hypothetical protein
VGAVPALVHLRVLARRPEQRQKGRFLNRVQDGSLKSLKFASFQLDLFLNQCQV